MKKLLLIYILLSGCSSQAQKQSFDLINYTAPKGWKVDKKESTVSFTRENKAKGTFCVITLYKTMDAGDDAKQNFDDSWESLVKETFTNTAPEMQPVAEEKGWTAQSGYASFEKEGVNGIVLLASTTGYGKVGNILILTNTDIYEKEMTAFLESVGYIKPKSIKQANTGQTQENKTQKTSGGNYQFTTSNFDDGFISTLYDDYVLVTKGNTRIYLNFAVPYNASQFSGTGVKARDHYWANYVSKYFTTQTKFYNFNPANSFSPDPEVLEGWAIDKQNGKRCYIIMGLNITKNAVNIVVAALPDEKSLRQQFPKAYEFSGSDLTAMERYNKFAIGTADLTGKWLNGNTNTTQWAYVTPSGYEGYAGMTVASSSAVFQFNSNGTYSSIHNGATGSTGNMNTFQQEYKGRYTVSNWNVTATNRYGGKTDKFDAYFKAVRGGRILFMSDGGQNYQLIKTK